MPGSDLPPGWRAVDETEAAGIIGHTCPPGDPPPYESPCPDGSTCCLGGGAGGGSGSGGGSGGSGGGCAGPSCGLATYSFQPLIASLLLADTPVGYTPARGPAVPFTLVYTHRDQLQPQIFTYTNLGPKWTFAWLRFVHEQATHGWRRATCGWRLGVSAAGTTTMPRDAATPDSHLPPHGATRHGGSRPWVASREPERG